MATTSRTNKKPSQAGSVSIDLFDPGMTVFHRVGLAGLAMTLRNLSIDEARAAADLQELDPWTVEPRSVVLRWGEAGPEKLLRVVFEHGLRLGQGEGGDGLIDFPAWRGRLGESPSHDARLMAHKGLLGSFIQHGRVKEKAGERLLVLAPDDKTPPHRYMALKSFKHQTLWRELARAMPHNKALRITGALMLGAVEKHPGKSFSRMEETPARFLTLCFAPVGALMFHIEGSAYGEQRRLAVLFPEVDDLRAHGRLLRRMGQLRAEQLIVPSAGDAAMQVTLAMRRGPRRAQPQRRRLCTVVVMGRQAWNTQQTVRTATFHLQTPRPDTLFNYRLAANLDEFQTQRRVTQQGDQTWFVTSPSRGAIARGLSEGLPWWRAVVDDFRRATHHTLERFLDRREQRGLYTMTQHAQWDPHEKLFVEACHHAMRQLYSAFGEQAAQRNTDFGQKVNAEMTRIRSSLLRAKNAESFRDALMDFWGRASRQRVRSNHVLQAHTDIGDESAPGWLHLLHMLDDERWHKSRDLAILALISYPGREQSGAEHRPATHATTP